MATANGSAKGYVKFDLEKAQTVTLASMDPVPSRGFNDELQHMYKLAGGKVMYVPPGVTKFFQDHGLQPGHPVQITKGRAPDGRNVQWTVNAEPPAKEVPITWNGQQATAILSSAPLEEYHDAPASPQPPNAVPETKLAAALKTAIQAARQAEQYGEEIGYSIRFSSSDIRAMGISVSIGMGNWR